MFAHKGFRQKSRYFTSFITKRLFRENRTAIKQALLLQSSSHEDSRIRKDRILVSYPCPALPVAAFPAVLLAITFSWSLLLTSQFLLPAPPTVMRADKKDRAC